MSRNSNLSAKIIMAVIRTYRIQKKSEYMSLYYNPIRKLIHLEPSCFTNTFELDKKIHQKIPASETLI